MGWIITLVIIAALVFWAVGAYNRLVSLRNRFKNAFAQIDVQLKRRYDLIPNLVNAVKGYMEFEQETLTRVVEARSAAVTATERGPGNAAQAAARSPGRLRRLGWGDGNILAPRQDRSIPQSVSRPSRRFPAAMAERENRQEGL